MEKYRRINLFGAPGCGKSTVAAWLFSQLKILDYSVELVQELAKKYAYSKTSITSWDQLKLTTNQITEEDFYLKNNVKLIITDSPIAISYFYSQDLPYKEQILNLANIFEKQYKSINIYIKPDTNYNIEGRFHSKEEAENLDNQIKNFVTTQFEDYLEATTKDKEKILKFILDKIQ